MLFGYDYCFCDYRDCPRIDCKRHHEWMPIGVPVSVSDFREFRDENGDCEYFVQGHIETAWLNLNTATEEDLMGLGLSENKAVMIVTVRETRGAFRSVTDLLKLRGIGKGTYEKVCNLLYVEG